MSPKMKSSTSIRVRLLSFFHNNLLYARRLADITAREIFLTMQYRIIYLESARRLRYNVLVCMLRHFSCINFYAKDEIKHNECIK